MWSGIYLPSDTFSDVNHLRALAILVMACPSCVTIECLACGSSVTGTSKTWRDIRHAGGCWAGLVLQIFKEFFPEDLPDGVNLLAGAAHASGEIVEPKQHPGECASLSGDRGPAAHVAVRGASGEAASAHRVRVNARVEDECRYGDLPGESLTEAQQFSALADLVRRGGGAL
jgi:hypothetical protein